MEGSKEPIKIIHVIKKATYGGAQAYVFDLVTQAKIRGFSPIFAFGQQGGLVAKVSALNVQTSQIKTLTEKASFFQELKAFFELYSFFKKEHPDIVHIHNSKFGIISELSARISGCKKIIFTSHKWHYNEDRPWWEKSIFLFFEWLTIVFSTSTIVTSETMYVKAPSFLFPKKLKIIKNGIENFSMYGKENAYSVLKLPFSNNSFVFGVISGLQKDKGLDILIKAFKEVLRIFPDAKLFIIGDGEEKASLETTVQNEKLSENIHFLGEMPDAREYLKVFNIFVLPSRSEALGYSILEAGIARIPCIATRVGGITEVVDHQKTGLLVSKNDAHELFLAMIFAIQNKELMESYAKNLNQKVLTEYTKKEMLEKTFALYSTPKNS